MNTKSGTNCLARLKDEMQLPFLAIGMCISMLIMHQVCKQWFQMQWIKQYKFANLKTHSGCKRSAISVLDNDSDVEEDYQQNDVKSSPSFGSANSITEFNSDTIYHQKHLGDDHDSFQQVQVELTERMETSTESIGKWSSLGTLSASPLPPIKSITDSVKRVKKVTFAPESDIMICEYTPEAHVSQQDSNSKPHQTICITKTTDNNGGNLKRILKDTEKFVQTHVYALSPVKENVTAEAAEDLEI